MTNGSVLKRPLILSLPLVKIDKMFGFFFPRVKEVCQTRNSIWLITCSSNTPAFFFFIKGKLHFQYSGHNNLPYFENWNSFQKHKPICSDYKTGPIFYCLIYTSFLSIQLIGFGCFILKYGVE